MGGSNPTASLPATNGTTPNMSPQQYNPDLASTFQKYMPSQYFGNSQISDPSAILNAYMDNLPAFQKGVQSAATQTPYVPTPQGASKSSNDGGLFGIQNKLDPISSIFSGLF